MQLVTGVIQIALRDPYDRCAELLHHRHLQLPHLKHQLTATSNVQAWEQSTLSLVVQTAPFISSVIKCHKTHLSENLNSYSLNILMCTEGVCFKIQQGSYL
jgi:hypothetical protein